MREIQLNGKWKLVKIVERWEKNYIWINCII